ncbi:MAG TPA: UDP-N-acetylglucosamine 1-carboxyvinyltransferase, partial [Paenibacillaceae bacterium]|nr:UDP-N-acetylglucosamine 1-carboxyvinyltransferase [Paenibacillaceae bacterium]
MDKIIIRGGQRLTGKVRVHGAKNAVLPIIAASILAENGESTIYEVPGLDDVYTISEVIKALNVNINYDPQSEVLRVDASKLNSTEAPYEWVRKMRASFLVMGPLLARKGAARIPLPGGCAIGSRGIDQHLKGFD